MALPTSGQISLNQVNTELGLTATAEIGMNSTALRTLFGIASGEIEMADGYGASDSDLYESTTYRELWTSNVGTKTKLFTSGTALWSGDLPNPTNIDETLINTWFIEAGGNIDQNYNITGAAGSGTALFMNPKTITSGAYSGWEVGVRLSEMPATTVTDGTATFAVALYDRASFDTVDTDTGGNGMGSLDFDNAPDYSTDQAEFTNATIEIQGVSSSNTASITLARSAATFVANNGDHYNTLGSLRAPPNHSWSWTKSYESGTYGWSEALSAANGWTHEENLNIKLTLS